MQLFFLFSQPIFFPNPLFSSLLVRSSLSCLLHDHPMRFAIQAHYRRNVHCVGERDRHTFQLFITQQVCTLLQNLVPGGALHRVLIEVSLREFYFAIGTKDDVVAHLLDA